ncbi:5-formyltetrahydrofolate cyclo-ligase [Hyphomicrobium sp.]|uniref:5-formyltetrahydrofolate cyclo-ligase n=1 Tax=Hyphomicrobium sp. TaxID=82 RepID=UPI003F7022A6
MIAPLTDAQRIWRREQRERLLDHRRLMPSAERRSLGDKVIANLDRVLAGRDVAVLGIYWPIKREIDLLPWATALSARRPVTLALPVVTTPKTPLEYCLWRAGDPMTRGFWNIPEPAARIPVLPDVVIAPLVGFCGFWRLGYGGGYFDRTLAARPVRPFAFGIGFEVCETPDFTPAAHDIFMNSIVTERRTMSSSDAAPF